MGLTAVVRQSRWGVLIACLLALGAGVLVTRSGLASDSALAVHVSEGRLVDAQGLAVRLLGVNRSGPEYACIQGLGVFAGPADKHAIAAMASWRINAVRVPLNEDCWLGINGAPPLYSGASYQRAIAAYVARLHRAGLYVVLDLHWNAPSSVRATAQQPMADLDHAPAFWSSVARTFKRDPAVIFDLYNEPHDISWECWLSGCVMPEGWRAAGMQTLVDAVRSSGARQPIIATGLQSGNDLSSWLGYRPHDPAHQLIAGLHVYDSQSCVTPACWNETVGPIARTVPVVTTEFGQRDCSHVLTDRLMNWADWAGVSYLGWSWNPSGCAAPALINSWDGQPTAYGEGLRDHLVRLRGVQIALCALPPQDPLWLRLSAC